MDFERKQVVVAIDREATVDPQQMIAALKEAGFGGSLAGKAARKTGATQNLDHQRTTPAGGARSTTGFSSHVRLEAFLDRDGVRPGGSFRVAVVVSVDDGWHVYGNPLGPGIGQPTVISAEGPADFDFEPVRYAPAAKHQQDFGDSSRTWVWEYEGRTIHFLSGRIPEDVKSDTARLMVHVKGQVCNPKSCLPGSVQTELTIPIRSAQTESRLAHDELFRGFDEAKPAAVPETVPSPGLEE